MNEPALTREAPYPVIFRQACGIVAAILVFDAVSQLALAVRPYEPWSALWRATASQLALTQVTIVAMVFVCAGVAAGGSALGRRVWAWSLLVVGGLMLVLGWLLVVDVARALQDLPLNAPEMFKRQAARGLVQGTLAGLACLLGAAWLLRRGPAEGPAEPQG